MGVDLKVHNYCGSGDYGSIIQDLMDIPQEIHCDEPFMGTYAIMGLNCMNQNFIATDLNNTNQTIDHSTLKTPSIIHCDRPFKTAIKDINCKNCNFLSTDLNTNPTIDNSIISKTDEEIMATASIHSEIGKPTQTTNLLTPRAESPKMNNTSSVASICSISPIKIIPVVENHSGELKPVGCKFSLLSCSIGSALFNLSLNSNDSEDEATDDDSSEEELSEEEDDNSIVFEDENSDGEDEVDCSYFRNARNRIPSESESEDGIVFEDACNQNDVDEVDCCPSACRFKHLQKPRFKIYEDEFSKQASHSMSNNESRQGLQQRLSSESEDGFVVFQNDWDDCSSTSVKKSTCGKKVQFASNLCSVRRLLHWDFAHRAARKGQWMQMSTDRGRFKMRILRCANALNKILDVCHRENIYKERFLDSTNQC